MAESSYEVVERFCKVWKNHNLDEVMAFFADDAEYQNVPMGPGAKGKAAVKAIIDTFWPMAKSIEFKVLRAAANGTTVMNERLDIFDLGNGKKSSCRSRASSRSEPAKSHCGATTSTSRCTPSK